MNPTKKTPGVAAMGLCLLILMSAACGPKQPDRTDNATGPPIQTASSGTQNDGQITRFSDLKGKKIASMTGTVFDRSINRQIKDVTHLYYNDNASMVEAVRSGKVSAWAVDEPVGRLVLSRFPDLMLLPQLLSRDQYGFAVRKGDPLMQQAGAVIRRFRRDGTLKAMEDKWLGSDTASKTIPDFSGDKGYDGRAGDLRFGHDPVTEPMSYIGSQGNSLGLDVELAVRIAHALNRKITLVPISFGGLIEALHAGKIDMAAGCMTITAERLKSVDFTVPYYSGGQALMIRKKAAVGGAPQDAPAEAKDAGVLDGARVGVMTGSIAEFYIEARHPQAALRSFDNIADAITALQGNKLDCVMTAYTTALNFVKHNPDLHVLPGKLINEGPGIAVSKNSPALRDGLNEILARFRRDGTLARVVSHWIKEGDAEYDITEIPKVAEGRILRVGIAANREPMCFIHNNTFAGLDCELIERMAYEMGMRVEYSDMQYSALVIALQSGKVDVIVSNMTPTRERREKVDFTEKYFDNPQVLIATKPAEARDGDGNAGGFLSRFADSFQRTFLMEQRYRLIGQGLQVTLLISILSGIIGTLVGFGICLLRRSHSAWASVPARIFIRTIQGTPIVVLLMILYYIVFGRIDISAILVAIIGFSLNFAAYASEMMRTGIDAVDKGQQEAAAALGFNRVQVFTRIIFPQAARHVLPVFKGEFISMVKMTSVVGYIAIQDLTKMSDIIRSRTYEAFFPLIATALIYFAIAYAMTLLLSLVEMKVDPRRRKRTVSGGAVR